MYIHRSGLPEPVDEQYALSTAATGVLQCAKSDVEFIFTDWHKVSCGPHAHQSVREGCDEGSRL